MNKQSSNNYLTCKKVRFYSYRDEDAFFEWIKKIEYIKKFEGARDELYLDLIDRGPTDAELRDLLGLFYRYNIEMQQLAQFLTHSNKSWFFDSEKYWFHRVFEKI